MPEGGFTPLAVIKLTYLCHGWMLGLYGRAFFYQPVEAWQHGPVIPDVYHRVKVYGNRRLQRPFGDPPPGFDKLEANLAGQVLEAYGEFSGVQLSALTHQPGSPWYRTWHERGRNAVISNDMIQEHFLEMAEDEE